MPSESGEIRSRYGGMGVSLASSDGRVVGEGVAGLLVAASPMQSVKTTIVVPISILDLIPIICFDRNQAYGRGEIEVMPTKLL
ncbi:hypothetical protein DEO72_LG10g2009 [Vigna unguiculata]|uniref:AT-hook motif nuclear-localized protein n=1 Tax=Vigna unguiculata TaxID=3917 RepID=A0A4D6NFP7_VIGUN|nr:hypothetical protein DEO72_LG10g2009 [Vigna unguiculata]